MSKFLVKYKVSTPVSSETYWTSISSPDRSRIEKFIVSRLRKRNAPCHINITSIQDLSEDVWIDMYVKGLGEKYQNI